MISSRSLLIGSLCAASFVACGGSPEPVVAPAPSATAAAPMDTAQAAASTSAAAPSDAPSQEEAHKLAVRATACWLGALWSDAVGEPVDGRKAADEARCHDLAKRLYGSDDQRHYERLRSLETEEVEMVAKTIDGLAKGDTVDAPRREPLVRFIKAIGAAEHEAMEARRAGDRVKRDVKKEPEKLSTDEVASVGPLKTHAALEGLLNVDVGDLAPEAHTLAVLIAMDRLDVAHGLPKHLKVYALSDALGLFFGIAAPDVPTDATKPLKPGAWLAYVGDAAKAAGHPVPATAKKPEDREPLAWAGLLSGFSDKLRADAGKIATTTDLSKVVAAVIKRLDAEAADASAKKTK